MPRLSDVLWRARTGAKLGEAIMSRMLGIDEGRLRKLESGEVEPQPDELEAYAQAFGVGVRQLGRGEAGQAPLTQLFCRSMSEGGPEALEELIATGGHRVLGELMRCVRDIAELEALLGHPKPPALPVPTKSVTELGEAPPYHADELAAWLRGELGLGLDPIPSMHELLSERLGIQILWVSPEVLTPVIDGASTVSPRPAILVNLVEGPLCWWRTRMTLAHELCHLLCDHDPGDERFTIFSPHGTRAASGRWRLFDGFEKIERRAGAFAACFLAPAEAVRRIVGARDVTSEDAISTVGQAFGLGRTTAINRLQHVFGLSKQTRLSMEARSPTHWPVWAHRDSRHEHVGLRSGIVRDLALEAFAAGKLSRVRVREYLRLPLTEPLPEHDALTAEQREPVRRIEDTVRGIAQQYVQEGTPEMSGCVATAVSRVPEGFRVDVEGFRDDAPDRAVPCGSVTVSHDLVVSSATLDASPLRRDPK